LSRFLCFCEAVLIVALIVGIVKTVYGQQNRWYAGYYLYDDEGDGYSGVRGRLFTINPTVSGQNFIAEWVSIVLQYYPINYWLQVGYTKGYDTNMQLKYFWEIDDSYGYRIGYSVGGPNPSSLHYYYMSHPYDLGDSDWVQEWRFYVDSDVIGADLVDPYIAIDQEAFVETTSSNIVINGSHFQSLSYLTNDHYWHWALWYTHVEYWNSPYSLVQTHDYEFYANGGG
jgi:hypothetical protein